MRVVKVMAWVAVLGAVAAGCGDETPTPQGETAAGVSSGAEAANPTRQVPVPRRFDLEEVANLDRVELDERQRELLERHGFFLAPQPPPPQDASAAEARTARRATHLFHVYERNDYIRFPSYVTVDLAIDATHSYFDAILRDVETVHLMPELQKALVTLMNEAEQVRRSARSAEAKRQAERAVAFWAVALRLVEQPASGDAPEEHAPAPAYPVEQDGPDGGAEDEGPSAPDPTPLPRAVRSTVKETVARVHAHAGQEQVAPLKARVDLSQMKPRGHYTRSGKLQRFFRSMSWLGMARYELDGGDADVAGVALLARSWLGAPQAAEQLGAITDVTAFFAGGPDAATLEAAAAKLVSVKSDAGQARADALLEQDLLASFGESLRELPAPRIAGGRGQRTPQIRVAGRRAFEDAVAMQTVIGSLLEALAGLEDEDARDRALVRLMGATGAAAALGSDEAKALVLDAVPAPQRDATAEALGEARGRVAEVPSARWDDDAYHGTLHALRALLGEPPERAPALMRSPAWDTRALYAFAGGWAELRHATILYGEQLGAECDAPEYEPPPGFVEPLPALYRRLAAMVQALSERLEAAGVPTDLTPQSTMYAMSLENKTGQLVKLLDLLASASERQLAGEPLDREMREALTRIGGRVEWLLISLANTDLLSERDQDMAVVADVFTHRPSGKVVEVGVARPDLVYAIVPTPDGPVIARGAVMSYRAFTQPLDDRLTDEQWRAKIEAGEAPQRPDWTESVYAEPVGAVTLGEDEEGVDRCGPMTGAMFEI